MGFKKFLNGAEYASLGLSVVGTIAAATTQQVAYAATPFTLLFSLNLINRKEELAKSNQRLVQLEQRFSHDFRSVSERIQTVQTSIEALPPSSTVTQLQEIKSLVQNNQQEIDRLEIGFRNLEVEIDNPPQPPESIAIAWVKESIEQLRNQSNQFIETFDRRPELDRIEEVAGNIKAIGDSLEKLQYQANSFVTSENLERLQKQLNSLTERLNNKLDSQEIEPLKTKLTRTATIEQIQQIQEEIASIKNDLSLLEDLDHSASALHDYDLELKNRINALETTLDREATNFEARLTDSINGLSSDLDKRFANNFQDFSTKIQTINEEKLAENLEVINQLLKERLPNYEYKLVFDRTGSRQVLLEALQSVKQELFLVCPWLCRYGFDDEVIQHFQSLLDREVKINIGWGHWKDFDKDKLGKGFLYDRLKTVKDFQTKYPDLCHLKILGTHEKYLVCDREFAMLGSHNFLTSSISPERELGLRTNDTKIIQDLIERFKQAPDLGEDLAKSLIRCY